MGIKVLVVDDAPFIREVLCDICRSEGHTVVGEADNGKLAVELALSLKPDIVLMDLVMPIKSGIEATKEILKVNPDQKIIACSTLDQNTMIMKAIEAGCIHYIVKPFQKADVVRALSLNLSNKKGEAPL